MFLTLSAELIIFEKGIGILDCTDVCCTDIGEVEDEEDEEGVEEVEIEGVIEEASKDMLVSLFSLSFSTPPSLSPSPLPLPFKPTDKRTALEVEEETIFRGLWTFAFHVDNSVSWGAAITYADRTDTTGSVSSST